MLNPLKADTEEDVKSDMRITLRILNKRLEGTGLHVRGRILGDGLPAYAVEDLNTGKLVAHVKTTREMENWIDGYKYAMKRLSA